MIALLFLLQESGAAWSAPLSTSDVRDESTLKALREFDVEGRFEWSTKLVREARLYDEFAVQFPSPVKTDVEANNTVHGKFFRPRGEGPFPALIVLHWLGGDYTILETFCARLAEADVAALFLYMPYYGPRRGGSDRRLMSLDLDATVAGTRQAVKDVRRARDWLRSRMDVGRVGVMGVSLGAFIAALAAGVDPTFDAVIPVIGGGDIAAVLTHESRETRGVKEELARRGMTEEELRRAIRDVTPATYASRIPRGRMLMIGAKNDEIIPRASTDSLYDAVGKPEIRWYDCGHYTIALHMPELYRDIVAWMRPVRWY